MRGTIDWQPTLVLAEPWRAFTAAWLHYGTFHLAANLAGTLLVGALGVAAQVPGRCAWAWLAAWPLTQLGLLAQPALAHYGGLSGVLHAGVAVVATELIAARRGAQRWIGATLLCGLTVKVALEAPWAAVLRHPAGWDIAIAPLAHASGLAAGVICAGAALALAKTHAAPSS